MSEPGDLDFGERYWRTTTTALGSAAGLTGQAIDHDTFKSLADNLPTLCWIANGDGYIVWYNRRWHDYCGTTPGQMEGWGWTSVHDPKVLPLVMERWTISIAKGEPFEMTFPLRGADGRFRPFLTRIVPMQSETGETVRWFGVNTDVSRQVEAEKDLNLARDRNEDILRKMGDGFVFLDRDFRILEINAEALRLKHRASQDIIGVPYWEIWPGSEDSEMGRLYRHAMTDRAPVSLERKVDDGAGNDAWIETRAYPSGDGLAIFHRDISDRVRSETLIKESEARFRAISNSVDQMIWSTLPDGYHDYYNQRWYDYTGMPTGSTDGDAWNGMFHPDDQDRAWTVWRHSLATGEPYRIEYRLRNRTGQYRWVLGRAQPIRDDVGRITRWFGTCTDIQDLVEAREVLTRSREELEVLVTERTRERDRAWSISRDLQMVVDPQGVIRAANDAWATILGWRPQDVVGRNAADFLHAGDDASKGEPHRLSVSENRYKHRDGGARWISWVTATSDNTIYASGRDITEEKEAIKALQLAQSRIRAIFETNYQFQAFLDLDGTLVDANLTALKTAGSRLDDVKGLPFWDAPWFVTTPGIADVIRNDIAKAAMGQSVRRDITVNLPAGARSFDFSIRPVIDDQGNVFGIVPEAMDTTERKQVEDALRQAQKMEAVGQLTGGIAHDFNNMLAVVVGSLDLLGRRTSTDDQRSRRYIEAATDGARRAASLTQRLLAFSRQQALNPESIDANKLVAGMSELLRRALGGSVRLETVLAGGLWRSYADQNQLENVILNLAVNARDAMPEGGRLTIETQNAHLDQRYANAHISVSAGQYVLIAVSDIGSGMPADVLAKAFDPFFTTKEVGKGTGLGLSQVYGFIKQSGGHVKIYSEPGEGTVVKVYLPRYMASASDESVEVVAPVAHLGDWQEVVLVVEDEPAVRQLSIDALGELGYRVLQADSAAAALRLLETHPEIVLLFTDVVMPDVNGRKLADEARRRRPDLKVLFTTGYTRNAVVHNGVLDPGVELIGKPFTIDELAAKVRSVLDTTSKP